MAGSRSGWRRWSLTLAVVAFAACSTGDVLAPPSTTRAPTTSIPSATTTRVVRPSTSTTTTLATLPPTTAAPLAPLSRYGLDITWITDVADDSPERAALEDGLVMGLMTGLGGPTKFTVIAFEDVTKLQDAWAFVTGASAQEAAARWDRIRGTARFDGRWRNGRLESIEYIIFARADSLEGWTTEQNLGSVMAHEWFHLHYYDIVNQVYRETLEGSVDDAAAPAWLVEGAAEWFSVAALSAAGRPWPGNPRPRHWLDTASSFSGLAGWEEDVPSEGDSSYGICAGAVDMLVELAGTRAVLETYWQARTASDASWRDVFAQVFGLTPAAFYALVDEYVADQQR